MQAPDGSVNTRMAHGSRTPLDARASEPRRVCFVALAAWLALGTVKAAGRLARALGAVEAASRVEPARGTSRPPIVYELDLRQLETHLVHVTMTVPDAAPATELQFPAWNALYQIRDFEKDVQELRARCDGRPAVLADVDLNTRRGGPQPCSQLRLEYAVLASGEPPFSSALNAEHAFLNPAMLLFYLPQDRERGVRVRFILPSGWKVATLLEEGEPDEFKAANYDELADSPVEAGTFEEYSYVQGGATYRVIVHAPASDYSSERLLKSLQKITATETALMRATPFSRYTFIFHFSRQGGGGGMEHRNGAAISIAGERLRRHPEAVESVAAHEFFHLWNVKRIRPQGLEPVDYVHGNDTSELWFSEGVTSTYGELALLRAGLISRQDFYSNLAEGISELERRPARKFQSVEQAGREAWLEKYAEYARPERSISYYNKGELLGYLLDLEIRRATANRRSLDDVMRSLDENFARRHRFFTRADLERSIAGLAPEFTGLDAFFRNYVAGTTELDYDTDLGAAGLRLVQESVEGPAPGFRASRGLDGLVRVDSVEPGSNAEKAGLERGDILLEINGRASTGLPGEQIAGMRPGQGVKFHVRRGSKILNLKFALGRKTETVYRVVEMPNPSPEQLAVRQGWLEGMTAQ
jgi:predicted metalloprotease with PDZ domain